VIAGLCPAITFAARVPTISQRNLCILLALDGGVLFAFSLHQTDIQSDAYGLRRR
jgi:hypothetical protein